MGKDTSKIDGQRLIEGIPGDWKEPTLKIARVMAEAGHRAWVVGGGVRDLILGRPIKDIDLVSAALPDTVEGLFPKTIAVGKAFGIVVVVEDGKELEMATFRRERGYSDSRHPDQIEYAETAEDDARRRDFTCNALYLDPLNGEIVDPAGGLADLAAGELRAVGGPEERFREDGLRLLRAGRFLAALDLRPGEGLLSAMQTERRSIAGVSPERVLDEVSKILRGPDPARAVGVLAETGVLELSLPGWADAGSGLDPQGRVAALRACLPNEGLGSVSPVALGLAVLLGPGADVTATEVDEVIDRIDQLKASRDLRQAVVAVVRARRELEGVDQSTCELDTQEKGRRVALARDSSFEAGASFAAAWAHDGGKAMNAVADDLRALSRSAPSAPIELTAKDAMAVGLRPGPALGGTLRRAKLAALGGAFDDRAGALDWLRAEVERAD